MSISATCNGRLHAEKKGSVVLSNVLLVGSRDGALRAAERMGLSAWMLSDRRPRAERRQHLEPGLLAERFIRGTEMSVESFVVDGRVVFRNPTEYNVPFWCNVAPAGIDRDTLDAVDDLNRRAISALGITRGITHLELFRTPRGLVFGEIAVRPPGGHLMELIDRAYGFDPWEALLEIELGRSPRLPRTAQRHAGVWLLHPGAGTVAHTRGLSAAARSDFVELVACRVRRGDTVQARIGSGNEVGHILASAPDRDQLLSALRAARELVRIEMAQPGREEHGEGAFAMASTGSASLALSRVLGASS